MQCRKEAVPVFTTSSHEQEEEVASSHAGSTPKNVITGLHSSKRTLDPTNVPEAPTLPRSCARKPWEYLCAACCVSQPKDDQTGPYIGVLG
jgi:hypothetical protein